MWNTVSGIPRIQLRCMPVALLISLLLLLGLLNGLRTLTPVAVLCWGAHWRWFGFDHSLFAFLASPVSLWIFTILAVGELIADKLPKTPARIEPVGLIGRAVFGAGCAAALAIVAGALPLPGALAGAAGALIGAYAGYLMRRALTVQAGVPDLPVALLEDVVAIGGAFFVVSRF